MPIASLLYTPLLNQIQPILHLRDLVKGLVLFSLIMLLALDQNQGFGDMYIHQVHRENVSHTLTTIYGCSHSGDVGVRCQPGNVLYFGRDNGVVNYQYIP